MQQDMFEGMDKELARLINEFMVVLMRSYQNDFVAVSKALDGMLPVISKPVKEASREEIELTIKLLFNTKVINYNHLREYTKLLFGDDSPIFVRLLIDDLAKRRSDGSDNPFANITEIDVD